jgi:hypothetical protein
MTISGVAGRLSRPAVDDYDRAPNGNILLYPPLRTTRTCAPKYAMKL